MTVRRETLRRVGGAAARAGVLVSAVMLLLTVIVTLTAVPHASAATNAGPATVVTPATAASGSIPLNNGGSATPFTLRLPTDAACTGDSADGGYRVQGYIVGGAVDPGTLEFGPGGPMPLTEGAGYRQPLFDTNGTGYVNAQTAPAVTAGGPGQVVSIPAFALGPPDVFTPGDIPAGTYNIGIACTLGEPGPTQVDKFWNVQIAVVVAANDAPAGITWAVVPPGATTTTTTGATTTSTAPGGSTTTTRPGATTTSTAPGSSTSTTTASGTAGGPSGTSGVGSVGGLPLTGSSTTSIVVWAVLLLAFGRMAVLLARPPRVKSARQ